MSCDVPVRECLWEHIRPSLADTKILNGGLTLRARCPACHAARALTISAGQQQRITWNCYTRSCDGGDVRAALLRAGVHAGCLPRGKGEESELAALAAAALREGRDGRKGHANLRAYLILLGYRRWPQGQELTGLAAEVGVGRREAYEARKAGPLRPASPGTSSTKHVDHGAVNDPEVSTACRDPAAVRSSALVRSAAQPKVRSAAQTLPKRQAQGEQDFARSAAPGRHHGDAERAAANGNGQHPPATVTVLRPQQSRPAPPDDPVCEECDRPVSHLMRAQTLRAFGRVLCSACSRLAFTPSLAPSGTYG